MNNVSTATTNYNSKANKSIAKQSEEESQQNNTIIIGTKKEHNIRVLSININIIQKEGYA